MNKKLYADDWQGIRNRILDRDLRRCQHCALKDRSFAIVVSAGCWAGTSLSKSEASKIKGVKIIQVFLQVAHLDNNKDNNNPSNLRSLCPPCHLTNDKEWKKLKRLAKS